MSANPTVSVVIPTHNHAHFLPECLACVRAQTHKDYEVIVVNNGSTDNTEEVVYRISWDQLRYYYQADTGSVAGPRNTAIKLARGEYVAFLDSDDIWYPRKLECVMRVLDERSDIDITSHDLFCVRKGRSPVILRCGPLKKDMFRLLLQRNPLLGSATVVKKRVMEEIGGFDGRKDFVHAEDSDAWLKIAYKGKKFYFINEVLGEYRVHSFNLSNDFKQVLLNEKNVIDKHIVYLESRIPFYRQYLYRTRLASIYANMGIQYCFRKKYGIGIGNMMKAVWYNPSPPFFKLYATFLPFFRRLFRIVAIRQE